MRPTRYQRQSITPRGVDFFLGLVGGGLFFSLSWSILLAKFYSVRNSGTPLLLLELLSIATASIAHMLFFDLHYTGQLHFVVANMTRIGSAFLMRLRSVRHENHLKESIPSNSNSHAKLVKPLTGNVESKKLRPQQRINSLRLLFLAFFFLLGIHIFVHWAVPSKHRQSQEILLGLIRVFIDGTVWLISTLLCLYHLLWVPLKHALSKVRNGKLYRWVLIITVGISVGSVMLVLSSIFFSIWSMDTISSLRLGILEASCDPCEVEGLRLNPALRRSWVLPDMIPWRLVERFRGRQGCHRKRGSNIGYIDEMTEMLVVSSLCRDGSKPRVFLECPGNSEMNGQVDTSMDEIVTGDKKYHAELEAKYGTPEKAAREGVIVHRNSKTGFISAVEIAPSKLTPVRREAPHLRELVVRLQWPSKEVLEIPLGRSAAYMVRCQEMKHEEFFLFPVKSNANGDWGVNDTNEANTTHDQKSVVTDKVTEEFHEPAGNVLIILIDALSRQGARRSLPRFVKWVRNFQKHRLSSGTESHRVFEPKGISTLGFSTAGNLCPYLTGTTIVGMGYDRELNIDMMNRTIFNIAKGKYGPAISTAFTVGSCHDFFEALVGNREASSGSGGPLQGVDYYLYQPLCHLEYSGLHSNFEGPYSIFRRCIDGRQVHEHVLDYTKYLLRRQIRQRADATRCEDGMDSHDRPCNASLKKGKYFFDLSYFLEAHEGSHGVIRLVDDALVDFMRHLEEDLRFFDDPLNTFIFAGDHGNHMGPYFEYTNAGQFERTTPAMLYIMHPEVMRRVDLRKGRSAGESMKNFDDRMNRLSTPLDFYMTLGDLTGVSVRPYEEYMKVKVPPASLFDTRVEPSMQGCYDFLTDLHTSLCSLSFCIPRDGS